MKTIGKLLILTMFVLSLPLVAAAGNEMQNMDHGKEMSHGSLDMKGHEGMMMDKDTVMLGEQVENGVKAIGHIKDVGEAMAKMGMQQTHHFMVMLMDTETGKMIDQGTVAVKITGPAGKEGEPIMLMGMQGHFGADVTLPEKGQYHFTVGTKLPDGEKRQFEFDYDYE